MRPRLKRLILIAPLAILGMLIFTWIGGEVVKHLWNWLLPPLFGWRQITFWQALGLLAALPDPVRRIWTPWFRSLQFPPSHGRALGAHDA